jgi:ribosome-associated protein
LEPLGILANRKKGAARLNRNSKIFKTIIRAIQERKGENLVSLDLRKIPEAVADFFIICEANNQPQIRAISDFLETEVKNKCGEYPYRHEGKENLQWVLIDYVNIVVHVMHPESRKFYKLEEMWSDAPLEEHEDKG